jgi:hypothetical protein
LNNLQNTDLVLKSFEKYMNEHKFGILWFKQGQFSVESFDNIKSEHKNLSTGLKNLELGVQ